MYRFKKDFVSGSQPVQNSDPDPNNRTRIRPDPVIVTHLFPQTWRRPIFCLSSVMEQNLIQHYNKLFLSLLLDSFLLELRTI